MKNNQPRIVHRTWEDVILSAGTAAKEFVKSNRFINGVYGIPRGGVCLAVLFSHLLKVEYLTEPRPGCLIVDDICDTGNTLLAYKKYNPIFYTDVAKAGAKAQPDLCGLLVSELHKDREAWFEFPWELASPPKQ
jgi:hypoxanthine phosphoribosyltransferase